MAPYPFTTQDILSGIPEGSPNRRLLQAVLGKNDRAFRAELTDMHCAPGLPSASGFTPLMAALLFGTDAMVDTLLDTHLININQQAAGGVTALHLAAASRPDFCCKIRARGADISLTDDSGRSALDLISDASLRKQLMRHPSLVLQTPEKPAHAFDAAARPAGKEIPATARDKKNDAENAVLRNDAKALQPHINALLIPQEEINALLALSLKTGDQPLIVHMLLTAGADPAAYDQNSRRNIFQLAFHPIRPHALIEIMRGGNMTLTVAEYFNCVAAVTLSKETEPNRQTVADAMTIHTLRRELRGASAATLESWMKEAVQDKNPLIAMAVFAESRKKHLLRRKPSFEKSVAGEALCLTIRAGYLLAAFDMKKAGFNLWDSKIAKELPDPPFMPGNEGHYLHCYLKEKDCPPRVLTPAEKITELRSHAISGFYPHGPGISH